MVNISPGFAFLAPVYFLSCMLYPHVVEGSERFPITRSKSSSGVARIVLFPLNLRVPCRIIKHGSYLSRTKKRYDLFSIRCEPQRGVKQAFTIHLT
jgi:hypothetical protein